MSKAKEGQTPELLPLEDLTDDPVLIEMLTSPNWKPTGPSRPPPVFDDPIAPQLIADSESTGLLLSDDPEIRRAEEACISENDDLTLEIVRNLLHRGWTAESLHLCLDTAVKRGNDDLVQKLLSVGIPSNPRHIYDAIEQESISMLSIFLEHGWDINEQPDPWMPSMLAKASTKSEPLVAWFLEHGADPNARCRMDLTPLSMAVTLATLPVVQRMFAHCPNDTVFRGQLFHCAAGRSIPDDCDAVLDLVMDRCKPNINSIFYEDDVFSFACHKCLGLGTALHEAASKGQVSMIRTLIAKGIDVSARDSRGDTALDRAERYGHRMAADEIRRHMIFSKI